jgi:hypothetical protein
MKRIIVLALLLSVLFIACNTSERSKQTVLTSNNLKSNFIALQSDLAYTLKTPKGAILKIAAGSFKVSGNIKIQLELKEAYSMQDILLAGLTTESNGKALLSGGMLYINATANGKTVDLVKPIKVSVPTEAYDNNMQLFKGEIKADSSINWVDPQPLDTSLTAKNLLLGEKLFRSECASCHKRGQDFTGPALAGCRGREPNPDWVYAFMHNAPEMNENDPYAKRLKQKFGSVQPSFPSLSKYDIKAILDYCDTYAALNPLQSPRPVIVLQPDSVKTTQPCGFDTVYYTKPDTSISIVPDNPVLNTAETIPTPIESSSGSENTPEEIIPLDFTDKGLTAGMYDFSINAFGWYNLDCFLARYPGLYDINLKVRLQMIFETPMHVYLFCPDKKLLQEAEYHNENGYMFGDTKGNIPLFLNDRAVLLAFGSKGDKIFYGTTAFNIKEEQTVSIDISETTEAALKSFIEKNNIDGIKIDVNKKDDFEIKQKPCDGFTTDTVKLAEK